MIKVVIRNEKVNLTIPVPMFLISSGVKLTKFIQKNMKICSIKDEDLKRVDEIISVLDMDMIAYVLKELKGYRGMNLVEVEGKDGSYILIKV